MLKLNHLVDSLRKSTAKVVRLYGKMVDRGIAVFWHFTPLVNFRILDRFAL